MSKTLPPPDLAFQLLSAANYIDALGGDSKAYRAAIAAQGVPDVDALAQFIRNQALEDAAKCCDEKSTVHDIQGKTFIMKDLVDVAHAIRAMQKDQP